jgi:tellurite resistance protein
MTDKVKNTEVQEETMAASSLHPAAKDVADPKSKIEMISHAIGAMHAMKSDELTKWFKETMAMIGKETSHLPAGANEGGNEASIRMKPSHAVGHQGASADDPMPKLSVKEDVEEMFSGSDLSEEFKEKATTIFEAAVTARTMLEVVRLEEEFEASLEEAVAEINEELTSKLDTYLDYVTEQWMEANEVAIESTLRNEVMEEFVDGLKTLFTEHYIEVPQDKVDVIESLATKVEELEDKLNEQITENVEMKRAFVEVEREKVLESYVSDLALSQQEKFEALAEGVDFDGDIEVYSRKLSIIKDKYFTEQKSAPVDTNITEETFEGETGSTDTVSYDPSVKRYADLISKTLRK